MAADAIRTQEKQSLNLKDYDNRVLVTGLSGCITYEQFDLDMTSYVNDLNEDIIFMSIGEKDGPERWIKDWCFSNNYPFYEIDPKDLEPVEIIDKYCCLCSNILMFTRKNIEFKLLMNLARQNKTRVTKVLVQ